MQLTYSEYKKNSNSNINTIKKLRKHKQQTSKHHTKKVNENIQPTADEYTLFITVTKNQKNVKLYN